MDKNEIKKSIISYCLKMSREGLSAGTSGNISARYGELVAITPSGVPYEKLTEDKIAVINLKGERIEGNYAPSSEWLFHCELYKKRSDLKALVHTHSHYATAIACLGVELPAVHYMIAMCGNKVPLASYETFGTAELAAEVVKKIEHYNGILLQNHGVIAGGSSLAQAYACAESIEFVAGIYCQAKSLGEPQILSDQEMLRVVEKFKNYGAK